MSADRELHHFVTHPHRFRIVQIVLEHSEQLPSAYEIWQFCPDLTRDAVDEYLEEMVDEGILREVETPPEDRREGYPSTFYSLTDHTWRFLMNHSLLESDDVVLRWQDIEVDDPERLAKHESAPRPDDVETFEHPGAKSPEERLKEYKMVVEQTSDALYMLDADGRYALVNEAYEELTGYSREELLGSTTSLVMDSDAMTERRELITELLNEDTDDRHHAWQSTLHTADGEELPVEVTFSVLEYNDEYVGIVGSARDISERKRRQRELSVLSRVLRHNLGNKVTVIQGYAEVIQQRIDDEVALDHARRILRTADRLIGQSEKARDINDLLQDWPPERRPVDVTTVVWDVLTDLEEEHPEADFRIDMPDSSWLRVPEELSMAIEELARNALEHTESDEPTIRVAVDENGDETAGIVVEDDGPGIPEDEVEVIETREETALNHSAGLGLWLVNWIVEAGDGTLTFGESDLGGARVRMEFAQADPPALTLSM